MTSPVGLGRSRARAAVESEPHVSVRARTIDVDGLALRSVTWRGAVTERDHAHANRRLVVLVAGEFEERFETRTRSCAIGSAFVRTPGESHRGDYGRDGGRYVSLDIPAATLGDVDLDALAGAIGPSVRNARLASLGARLANEFGRDDAWSAVTVRGLAYEIVGAMGRADAVAGRRPRYIDEVCALIREGDRTSYSLAELAAVAGVHPAYLGRSFRRHVGVGIGEFQRRMRLEAARQLIETTTRTLADIAAATGFCDQSHLTRSFRAVFGTSPALVRRHGRIRFVP